MSSKVIFLFGDSHYAAIAAAAEARALPQASRPPIEEANEHNNGEDTKSDAASLYIFNAWKYNLLYPFTVSRAGERTINPEIYKNVCQLAGDRDIALACIFGGGHGHVVGMIAQGAVDLYVPELGDDELNHQSSFLPRSFVESIFLEYIPPVLENYATFRKAFPKAHMLQLETPPCIGDDIFIQNHLGSWFAPIIAMRGGLHLNPPQIRRKINWLESDIFRRHAGKHNYEFLARPSKSTTQEGFLKPHLYAHDAVHANTDYGELVLQKLEKQLNTQIKYASFFG